MFTNLMVKKLNFSDKNVYHMHVKNYVHVHIDVQF